MSLFQALLKRSLVIAAAAAFSSVSFSQTTNPCHDGLTTPSRSAELAVKIIALGNEGVSQKITDTLLTSLHSFPEKWSLIGDDLIEATHMTNLIERRATQVYSAMIPLNRLATTHNLLAPYDLQKLKTRTEELQKHLPEILAAGKLDSGLIHKLLPSEGPLRAAKDPEGHFYVFDGNGRTEALRHVLGQQHAGINIEVLVYEIEDQNVVLEIQTSQKRRKGTVFRAEP